MKTWKTPKGTELPILNLKGKDYLQVAHRIVWMREEHPDWSITTEFVSLAADSALAKATIYTPSGQIVATSHKFEDAKGFPDFREKAETGAVGRALALCGYGTQFCGDELDEKDRLADSPTPNRASYGLPSVYPDEPAPGDGFPDTQYRITFGKYAKRSLEEVGPGDLKSYVAYLESKAAKDGKPIQGQVADFIKRVENFVGAFENQS